jgi:hypothetical protein
MVGILRFLPHDFCLLPLSRAQPGATHPRAAFLPLRAPTRHRAPWPPRAECTQSEEIWGRISVLAKGHTEQATSTAALLGREARAQPRARPRPSLGCRAAASRGRVAHHLRGTQHATKPTKEAAHTPTATQPHPRAAAWATPSAHNCSSAAPPPARSHATNPECLRCSTNARVASVTRHGPTWPSVAHNSAIEPGSAWRATDEVCGWGDRFASTLWRAPWQKRSAIVGHSVAARRARLPRFVAPAAAEHWRCLRQQHRPAQAYLLPPHRLCTHKRPSAHERMLIARPTICNQRQRWS